MSGCGYFVHWSQHTLHTYTVAQCVLDTWFHAARSPAVQYIETLELQEGSDRVATDIGDSV